MEKFSVHLKFRDGTDEHILAHADNPLEAILAVARYFHEGDGIASSRRWVESITAHWLHIELEEQLASS